MHNYKNALHEKKKLCFYYGGSMLLDKITVGYKMQNVENN
jgi:hypothetical protein